MFLLKPGLHDFQQGVFGSTRDLTRPASARTRDTLMIACAGHGTAPDNVSCGHPGRFSILQHIGASVPSRAECEKYAGLSCDGIRALFDEHRFRHVVVCGHLGSAVIRYWLQPVSRQPDDTGDPRQRFQKGTRDLVDNNYSPQTVAERSALMVCEHVLCQLENLLTHPFVRERVVAGTTSVHGWVIDDATARVFAYSPDDSAFVPVNSEPATDISATTVDRILDKCD